MKVRNENPYFGDAGPFDSDAATPEEAFEEFADEMQDSFEQWADDQESRYACDVLHNHRLPDLMPREKRIAEMRREFIKGLSVEVMPGFTVKEV